MVVVRFADDFVVGFEHREEADRFLAELRERLAPFGLSLHPDKTIVYNDTRGLTGTDLLRPDRSLTIKFSRLFNVLR